MNIKFTFFKLVIKKFMNNDKKAVWDSIEYLRTHSNGDEDIYIDLRDNVWIKYSPEKRIRIRALLLSNKLVGHKNQDSQWAFQLTVDGILAKKSHLRRDGLIRYWYTESFKGLRLILLTVALTTLGSLGVELYKYKYLTQDHLQTRIKQTIQQYNDRSIDSGFVNSNRKK